MIPGVVASDLSGAPSAPNLYVANAVAFSSAILHRTLSCTNNEFCGFAGWFKEDWSGNNKVAWVVDPAVGYDCYLAGFGVLAGGAKPVEFNVQNSTGDDLLMDFDSATGSTTWHHMIGAAMVNAASGSKKFAVYVDDTKQTISKTEGSAFTLDMNGKPIYIGGDTFGNNFTGSMADLSIWMGFDLMEGGSDISLPVRRLFIDADGKAVDPTIAIAALGAPPVFLTGNAASFASNALGTNGSFTVTGSLTNDGSPPP
jgi:hypothetical protein